MSDTTQNADLPRDYHARKAAERILGDADDLFATGGNPRERSLPGKGPGEKQYAKTRDQTGRMISEKPANKPFLAWQRYKAAEAEKERRRAAGEVLPEDVPKPWTLSSYLLGAFFTIGFIGYVGNWVTGSPAWGYEAQIAKQWKQVNPWRPSQIELTDLQLAAYDGSDLTKPIYVGLDGDVWDVTPSRRLYGPGGAYSMMAGRDAARAFTTGCFQTHLTHDLRGLGDEEMAALANWKSFFANHDKYNKVGVVKHAPIDPNSPIPEPCNPPAAAAEAGSSGAGAAHGKSPVGQKVSHNEL